MQYGIMQYLRYVGVGNRITIFSGKAKRKGILTGIDAECLCFEDEIGIPCKISISDIDSVELEDEKKASASISNKEVQKALDKFTKSKRNASGIARMQFSQAFIKELNMIFQKIDDPIIKDYFSPKRIDNTVLDNFQAEVISDYFADIYQQGILGSEEYLLLRMIVYLKTMSYEKCISECLRLNIENPKYVEVLKILSFVMSRVRDDDQAYYWLEKYFLNVPSAIAEDNALWWRFLEWSVEFGSYVATRDILSQLNERDNMLTAKSIVFLYALNNRFTTALSIYEQILKNSIPKSQYEIQQLLDSLREEEDNKYHRMLRCIERIKQEMQYRTYEEDTKIQGYVFEYVPLRSYGFILGFDRIKYFFHLEDMSNLTIKMVKGEICSIKPVNEENLCLVEFDRTKESKRLYAAYNIV